MKHDQLRLPTLARLLTLALLALLALPIAGRAQTITAPVTGAVTDPTGAVVPNAAVTVTSAETKLSKTATTDDAGRFTVPYLNPGVYDITVQARHLRRAD